MKNFYLTIIFITLLFPRIATMETFFDSPKNINLLNRSDSAVITWQNPENRDYSKTIVFRSSILIESYFSYEAIKALCDKIYEGSDQELVAQDLAPNLDYWFVLFASDINGNTSKAKVIKKNQGHQETQNIDKKTDSLVGASSEVVNEVSFSEAGIVYNYNRRLESEAGSDSQRLALFIIVKSPHDLSERDKNAISYFIDAGTPTTILLGAGERTGVLNSYLNVFEKLPTNILDWQDVIKIANGRWPSERNLQAEEKAAEESFATIYKRQPNMDNSFDNAAVTVIAYGLRPAQRNMQNESRAIETYRSIFKKSPIEAFEWDIVRAIAYSGASR